MFRFPLTKKPKTSEEPFSLETLGKASRLRGAHARRAFVLTALLAAGSSFIARAANSSTSRAIRIARSAKATCAPRGQRLPAL